MSADPRECPKRCPESLGVGHFEAYHWCEFLEGHAGMHRGSRVIPGGPVVPDSVLWWGTPEEHAQEFTPAGIVTVHSGEPLSAEIVEALRKAFGARGGAS